MPKRSMQRFPDDELEAAASAGEIPDLRYFPAGQIEGDAWVIGVLLDLIAFAEHRELDDVRKALEKAHRIAVRKLLN